MQLDNKLVYPQPHTCGYSWINTVLWWNYGKMSSELNVPFTSDLLLIVGCYKPWNKLKGFFFKFSLYYQTSFHCHFGSDVTWKQCLFCICVASVSSHYPTSRGSMLTWSAGRKGRRHGKHVAFMWCHYHSASEMRLCTQKVPSSYHSQPLMFCWQDSLFLVSHRRKCWCILAVWIQTTSWKIDSCGIFT